jgi:hypothetical protein
MGAMQKDLFDQMKLIKDGKADPEVSEALLKESSKVIKEFKKRIREME